MLDRFGSKLSVDDLCIVVKNNRINIGFFVEKLLSDEGLFKYVFNETETEIKMIQGCCTSKEIIKMTNEIPNRYKNLL